MGEKLGFVSVMAAFRNAVFAKLLLGESEYAKQFERKGPAAGWQHPGLIHSIAWGHCKDDVFFNKVGLLHIILIVFL